MPWCPGCDRFLSPATVATTGTCPRCGGPVDPGRARAPVAPEEEAPEPLPWHFKLLAGAIVGYLGWRAVQGVAWLIGRL